MVSVSLLYSARSKASVSPCRNGVVLKLEPKRRQGGHHGYTDGGGNGTAALASGKLLV